jgi:ABC-2 type transport system ATP-binding protein
LLRVLATLRRADAGRVEVGGHDVRRPSGATAARLQLGYLPQQPTALMHLRVREAVEYAAWLKRVPRGERADRVTAALVDLDLVHRAADRVGALSGGTRQRAHIAQAIVHGPDVLLLDEPTTGVDAEHRVELRQILRRLARGRLVVLSTHLTEDIELLADRVTGLDHGRVRFDGTPTELALVGEAAGGGTDEAEPARAIERGLRALGTM